MNIKFTNTTATNKQPANQARLQEKTGGKKTPLLIEHVPLETAQLQQLVEMQPQLEGDEEAAPVS